MNLFVTRLQATHDSREFAPGTGVEVSRLGDQNLEFSVGAAPAVGALVNLTLELRGGSRPMVLDAVGKVSAHQIEKDSPTAGARVQVQMRQYDAAVWEEICRELETRQNRADGIFRKMKGES